MTLHFFKKRCLGPSRTYNVELSFVAGRCKLSKSDRFRGRVKILEVGSAFFVARALYTKPSVDDMRIEDLAAAFDKSFRPIERLVRISAIPR